MPKNEFTSFDVTAVVKELKSLVLDSRVNNIYQFDQKTIVFKLHKSNMPSIRLVVESGRRIHSTVYAEESPAEPPAFCMMLRHYLRDSWFDSIEQYEFERIVILGFRTKTGLLRLAVELFGDGNLILINPDGIIIQALFFKKMRDRNILHGEKFQFPPSTGKNPLTISKLDLQTVFETSKDVEVVRVLARSVGLGGTYAEEILLRAGVEKNVLCKILAPADIAKIFDVLQTLLSNVFEGKFDPRIIVSSDDETAYLDVTPFNLQRHAEGCLFKGFQTFSEALDEFFLKVKTAEKALASVEVDKLQSEQKRIKRMIADQEAALAGEEAKSERDKTVGNTIYAHFNEFEMFLNKLVTANQRGAEWSNIFTQILTDKKAGKSPEIYVEGIDTKNLVVNFFVDDLHFGLNLRLSIFDNANEYYERGKRSKQKSAGTVVALADSKRKLAKLERDLAEAEHIRSLKPAEMLEAMAKRKVETKDWYEKFRYFTTSEGFLVVAGKDVVTNEILIKKYTRQEDVVFHAEITGSPFVVIKAEGRQITDQALKEAGEYAAAFCRAWRENVGSADIYWVKVDQLSKSGPSGESVPHGAFFVIGKRNWMRNTTLKTAIGIEINETQACFIGGSIDAVRAKAKSYVVIVPGDHQGKDLLKMILKTLTLKLSKEDKEKLGKTSIEQIREYIPYTKGTINQKPT
ncbi:MAG: NFACT family protein [Candidatus Bathyarchaeota archaeon]|nr:NFACT family protein [Candidatus Termiticorpusculum sp.]